MYFIRSSNHYRVVSDKYTDYIMQRYFLLSQPIYIYICSPLKISQNEFILALKNLNILHDKFHPRPIIPRTYHILVAAAAANTKPNNTKMITSISVELRISSIIVLPGSCWVWNINFVVKLEKMTPETAYLPSQRQFQSSITRS